jgi:PIN domain nuclease of toxin-antitoxin system
MRLLLDTHAFLWLTGDSAASERAKAAFLDNNNELYFSMASYWEICIKVGIGKLKLGADWQRAIDKEVDLNAIQWLPVEKVHCQKLIDLPLLHGDPFDRMLIAQALSAELTLMTADRNISQYAVPTLW